MGDLIEKLAGPHVVDLVWHLPSDVIDRRHAPKIADARPDTIATMTVRVTKHYPPHNKRQPLQNHSDGRYRGDVIGIFSWSSGLLEQDFTENEIRVIRAN